MLLASFTTYLNPAHWNGVVWTFAFLAAWLVLIYSLRRKRVKKQSHDWGKRAAMIRVRLEFDDGAAVELTGIEAQRWHSDMFFDSLTVSPLSEGYPWAAVAPIGKVASPTHPADEVKAWALEKKEHPLLDELWSVFKRLFYQHERFDPNPRDTRAQDLFSWFFRGVAYGTPVFVDEAKPQRWRCRRCGADVVDGRCKCEHSPSPWEPIVEAPAASDESRRVPPSPAGE